MVLSRRARNILEDISGIGFVLLIFVAFFGIAYMANREPTVRIEHHQDNGQTIECTFYNDNLTGCEVLP